MAESAFGIDHGDFEKSLGDKVAHGYLQAKSGVQGFKLARAHGKLAHAQAGYRSGLKGQKDAFQAGMRGQGKTYGRGLKHARSAAKKRFNADLQDMSQGRKPGQRFLDPGMADRANASFNRGMSTINLKGLR